MKYVKKKVPVFMQMEALECGAASLSMILAYFGKWLPLPEVRTQLGVSRDGVSALSIIKGARNYGMEGVGYRIEAEDLAEKIQLPCILFWNRCHFVVLTGFSRKGACINDPACGAITVPMDKFCQQYSGIALEITPGPDFVPGGQRTSIWPFVKKRLRGAGGALVFLTLSGLAAAAFGVVQPVLSRTFLDKILAGTNTAWLGPLLGIMAVLAIIQFALNAVTASYANYVQGKFAVSANCSYVEHILRLPMQFFSQRMSGDIAGRQADNAVVAQTLLGILAPAGVGIAALAVYLTVMVSISPILTLIGVSALLLNLLIGRYISHKRLQIVRRISRDNSVLSGTTAGVLGVMETIKAGGTEEGTFARWTGLQASVLMGQTQITKINTYLVTIPKLLLDIANAVLMAMGALLIMQGKLTVGMLLAMQSLLQSLINPVGAVIEAGQELTEMRAGMERIEDVTNYEKDAAFQPIEGEKYTNPLTGKISVRNLTFGYSSQSAPVLKEFSMELAPGKKVALAGGSGSGKSTIAKLVAGLYQPWSGEILFDGRPISAYDRTVFTSSVAVVDQDIMLFSGTVKDNFRFADGTVSEMDMIKAAKDAQVHEAILKHEGGYDALIAEGGGNFSGGQRQQLEIARVLAGNPSILILDEATSALDAETEKKVMDAIQARGMTLLVVAHRLSTIRDADEILMLKDGVVVERGTHDQLFAMGGEYTALVMEN